MKIEHLNVYKKEFLELIDTLPIQEMEYSIKTTGDDFILELYDSLQYIVGSTPTSRYKKIYHDLGICSIYALIDPVYSDPIRFMFHHIRKSPVDIKAKPVRLWRVKIHG